MDTETHFGSATPQCAPIIEARHLEFDYGGEHQAVNDVSLTVAHGEIFALLGTNGAGKTTTLELLQGFRRASGGSLSVFGVTPHKNAAVLRARTGVVLQEAGHFGEITVAAQMRLWASISSRIDNIDAVLDRVELTHRLDTKIDSLSGGERRRLDLAMAIWGSPELVILDEPTTGLDPESRRTLWGLVRNLRAGGTTVVLTTHYLEEAEELADRVAIMHRGSIAVEGTLDEVLSTRPSRIQVDVPSTYVDLLVGDSPDFISISTDTWRRQADSGYTALQMKSDKQQESLGWLLDHARRSNVVLGPLRASPASLEEVFHHIRNEDREPIS